MARQNALDPVKAMLREKVAVHQKLILSSAIETAHHSGNYDLVSLSGKDCGSIQTKMMALEAALEELGDLITSAEDSARGSSISIASTIKMVETAS